MNELNNILFALLRSILFDDELDCTLASYLDAEVLEKLYKISKKHDMAHLVGAALDKNEVSVAGVSERFSNETMTALYRTENLTFETERICKALDSEGIDYIPLKGAVIRKEYPESWMRTSCDVDILVREADVDRAVQTLTSALGYTCSDKRDFHDVDLYSDSGVHLELHFSIKENISALDRVLDRVWDYAVPALDGAREYKLIREFLIYHIIAHSAYHFAGGGCGIRPFLDLFLLTRGEYDREAVRALCIESDIAEFFEASLLLADVWFANSLPTPLVQQMEDFVLSGGVYGTEEAHIAVRQKARGGKIGYVGSRVFVSYDHLKLRYPTLKNRAMLPIYQVRRWIDVFRDKSFSRSLDELKTTKNLDREKVASINSLMRELGLSDHIK